MPSLSELTEQIPRLLFRAREVLRRYWWVLVVTLALALAHQVWKHMNTPPYYISRGEMFIPAQVSTPGEGVVQENMTSFLGNQIDFMKSSMVAREARQRVQVLHPDLEPAPVSLSVSIKPDTTIFSLEAVGAEPAYTQAYLDGVMESFINFRKRMRAESSESAALAIHEKMLGLEKEVEELEEALFAFQEKHSLVALQEQGSLATQYLARVNNQIADLETQLRLVENLSAEEHLARSAKELAQEDSEGAGTTAPALRLPTLEAGSDYQQARAELEQLQTERDEYATYLKARHPKMIRFQSEIERMQRRLGILREQAMVRLSEQEVSLKRQLADLRGVADKWEEEALAISRLSTEHERLKTRLERAKQVYDQLLQSIQNIDLSMSVERQKVAVLKEASPAQKRASQLREHVVAGAGMGFGVGFAVLVVIGLLDNRIVSSEDLEGHFHRDVLGVIPLEKSISPERADWIRKRDDHHLFAESCRNLRSSLVFSMREENGPQVLAVTSAVPAEGKSTITCNLGIALAQMGKRTILIDGDLRRGTLNKFFDRERKPGFSELLTGAVSMDDVLSQTAVPGLDLITSGEYPKQPGELLVSGRMDEVLAQLRARYDYVLFDTAPVMASDDTTGLLTKTDGALFCVRSGSTTMRQVKLSLNRLKTSEAAVLGFVLNFVSTRNSDYYYYRKYSRYYDYRAGEKETKQTA